MAASRTGCRDRPIADDGCSTADVREVVPSGANPGAASAARSLRPAPSHPTNKHGHSCAGRSRSGPRFDECDDCEHAEDDLEANKADAYRIDDEVVRHDEI